jgi:ribosomal protein S3AE
LTLIWHLAVYESKKIRHRTSSAPMSQLHRRFKNDFIRVMTKIRILCGTEAHTIYSDLRLPKY